MRLRRKNSTADPTDVSPAPEAESQEIEEATAGPLAGPVDVEELDEDATYIDLGSLLVRPTEGLDLRLQVDEESGTVLGLMMLGEDGVVEMRAFADSRSGNLWADARREIAADTAQRGGTAREQDGPFGPELYCEIPVTGPEGEAFIQPSRVVGWTGPRWFLRATIAGRPAQDAEQAGPYEDAIRAIAVRRGAEAMAPGTALPLRLPPEARPQTPAEAAADAAAGHTPTA